MTRNDVDEALRTVARRRHLTFRPSDVLACGGDRGLQHRRVQAGRWINPHPHSLALPGYDQRPEGPILAAIDSLGAALASHECAGFLLRVPTIGPGPARVAVAHDRNVARPFAIHRHRGFELLPVTMVGPIPCVSLPVVLTQLAASWGPVRLQRVVEDLVLDRRTSVDSLARAALRHLGRGHAGTAVIGQVLDALGPGDDPPPNHLERILHAVLQNGGFPRPQAQGPLPALYERGRVDGRYDHPHPRLIVEADGRRWHTRIEQLDRDERRDNEAQACGFFVARFSYATLTRQPEVVWEILGRHFERAGWRQRRGLWVPATAAA